MTATRALAEAHGQFAMDAEAILNALPDSSLALGAGCSIYYANAAAEQFFGFSAAQLREKSLSDLIPLDSPLFALIDQVRATDSSVIEYGVTISSPRTGNHAVTIQVAPIPEMGNGLIVILQEQSIAEKIDRQLTHRNAARSITALAHTLAHEIRNPLSGIRGAAQLLEQSATEEDRVLTRLICDEADRLSALVDRVEAFTDEKPIGREPVNIHQVLERVRRIAESGFARHVHFREDYDPSLPEVSGNHDQLIQAFLNLTKNAVEAVPSTGGEIVLSTAYRHGVRLAVPSTATRLHLPLMISVQDNGGGVPDDLRSHLFDPFVTTKINGTGLGLSVVAKIIGDHGGVIEFDSQPRRTIFRVMLPVGVGDPAPEENIP